MLEIRFLNAGYADTQVLWDVSLQVGEGEIVALVGSNGAGKSTMLAAVSGLVRPFSGEITFEGRSLVGQAPEETVKHGIAHVPQGRRLFPGLSVKDNVRLGAYLRHDSTAIAADMEWILELFPGLRPRLNNAAGSLSGGEQQMVAIGRALMSQPKLLMIDELSLGLAPVIVDSLLPALTEINRRGAAILLVEQDVQVALEVSHRGYVLETGHIVMADLSSVLLANPQIKAAFLGI